MEDDSSPAAGAQGAASNSDPAKAPRSRSKNEKNTPRGPRKRATKSEDGPELDLGPASASEAKPKPRPRKVAAKTTGAPAAAPAESPKPAAEPKSTSAPAAPVRDEASAPRNESPKAEPKSESTEGSRSEPSAKTFEPSSREGRETVGGRGQDRNADRRPRSSDSNDNGPRDQQTGDEGDGREPWWKRNKGGREKRGGKRGKWKKGNERERPPAQPLPPGMAEPKFGDLPDPEALRDLEALDAAAKLSRESTETPIQLRDLYPLAIAELGKFGHSVGAAVEGVPGRRQWLEAIFKVAHEKSLPLRDHGWLDLNDNGYGFIVHDHVAYRLYPENTFIPPSLVKRYGLKRGHEVEVVVRPPHGDERCPVVIGVDTVMGRDPTTIAAIPPFEELEPYYPLKRILMEAPVHKDISMRAVDLLTPIGFGQRGLIVAPPRTGKTVLLQNMANSVTHNFPEMKLILLLIDERPEEVTDFKRHTKGEVVSSTFDEAPTNHVHAAEMVIEKARRLVELGEHVVILLDSITRLARAYNALASNSGKIMSGGIEATAMQKPKRFFGSARNIEGAGSLTILGTALVDTNSKMDEVIFEEFKGTGNMELHLDRGLSDKRIFPAINIDRSGTRKEELIYHPAEMERVYGLRRAMQGIPPVEAMEMFITRLRKTKSNAEFLMSLNK